MDDFKVAFEVVSAAFEEAMNEQGLLTDAIKVISANAARILDELDEAHLHALALFPREKHSYP
jgi:hypothetical protein